MRYSARRAPRSAVRADRRVEAVLLTAPFCFCNWKRWPGAAARGSAGLGGWWVIGRRRS